MTNLTGKPKLVYLSSDLGKEHVVHRVMAAVLPQHDKSRSFGLHYNYVLPFANSLAQ